PIEKIKDLLLQLLDSIFIYYPTEECAISKDKLEKEADKLYAKFKQYAKVPFRDATIKNMALDCPELDGLDNIIDQTSKSTLKEKIKEILREDSSFLNDRDIIDFDFSSAHQLTTKYDDFIGLNMHERTYNQTIEDKIIEQFINNEEFAISLFVRYLRFGGRKYLYRLMHPSFHSIRFKYDHEKFYFQKFIYLIDILYPEFREEYLSIYEMIKTLSVLPTLQHKFDLISNLEGDIVKPWLGLYKD
ncbi:MAG: hypothetical protein K2K48_01070, partial [Anaeroplasmataceae bacterium]|nr:hypothetical protein [Anaeroplasmataceae bacterium]